MVFGLGRGTNVRDLLLSDMAWSDLLKRLGVADIVQMSEPRQFMSRTAIILSDGTYFRANFPPGYLQSLAAKWDEFRLLRKAHKEAVIAALIEYAELRPMMGRLRHMNEPFVAEAPEKDEDEDDDAKEA